MTPNSKNILIITIVSIVLSCGILMIIIPCAIIGNWWPLLSILFFAVSLIFPMICGACQFGKQEDFFLDDSNDNELGGTLAWLLTGIVITIGFSIPFEMFRLNTMSLLEFLLTLGGGIVILIAVLCFKIFLI